MTAPARPVAAMAVIAAAESVVLVAYAIFDLVEAVRVGASGPEEVSNVPGIILLIVITGAFGVSMAWVARGLWRCRRWARSPFVLAQIITVLIGWELSQATGSVERTAGIVLALAAVLGIVLAFSPTATRALAGEGEG